MRLSAIGQPCPRCGSDEIEYRLTPIRGTKRWIRICSRCYPQAPAAELQRRREVPVGLPLRLHGGDDPEDVARVGELREAVLRVMETLTFREREVIRLRYLSGRAYTLDECGRVFKCSRERIYQIEKKAIRKMQHPERAGALGFRIVTVMDGDFPRFEWRETNS